MKQAKCKHLLLAIFGGEVYVLLEMAWRGHSHWTMFLLGGICFLALGLINEVIPWEMPLWIQVLIGACIVTALEFLAGCVVNLWLGWDVWDYSDMPFNLWGQVCPQFAAAWLVLSWAAVKLENLMHKWAGDAQ